MKVSVFCVLFFVVVATALMFLFSFSGTPTSSSVPDKASIHHGGSLTMITRSRKLKENGCNPSTTEKNNARSMSLEDYSPIDRSPTTKASIRPGPIEHGSPLIPYIPKPSPPGYPKNG